MLGVGFILDGFPRTAVQAGALDALLARLGRPVQIALELMLDEATLAAQLMLRARIQARIDDRLEVFLHRTEEYRATIPALRAHYEEQGRLVSVDGHGGEDDVFARIAAALGLSGVPVSPRRRRRS